ncbi:hypothetical protein GCM10010244_46090 [Streptomyces coeruleorubidus]|nr:hypothetical protein GCM10010244_46090 [Streptomyces bellus]
MDGESTVREGGERAPPGELQNRGRVRGQDQGKAVKHLVKLTVDSDGDEGSGTASVTATDGHPFWVPNLGEWVEANEILGKGVVLLL